jgi:ribosome-binding factor A
MSRRTERVGSVIQELVTGLLTRGRLKDPRIHELTTITGVKVSGDLSVAKVFFTVLGEDADLDATAAGLEAAKSFIQRHLKQELRMRVIPVVRFEYDPSVAYGDRINRILSELPELQRQDADPSEPPDADEDEDEDGSS